jgi:uncharacterized protein
MILLIISLSIFILVNIFRITIPFVILNRMANRHVDFREVHKPEDFGIESQHFFVTTEDGLRISCYEVQAENPKAVIICLPGIHYPSATAYSGHARIFRNNGFATLFFDMRSHGESDGKIICMGYHEHLDVRAVVKYIKGKQAYKNIPIIIMGLSLGASTAIISAGEMPEINGVISLSAFSAWEDIFCDKMNKYAPAFFTRLERPLVLFSTNIKYGIDSKLISPANSLKKIGNRPVLLMHSRDDSEVPFSNFERLMKNAPPQVETFVRKGDFHMIVKSKFTTPEKDPEYLSVLLGFLDRNFSC